MTLFLVTYDLVDGTPSDYQELWDAIERLDSFKPLRSVYLVNSDTTSQGLRNHLAPFVDDEDRLIVVRFSHKPAFTKAFKGTSAWLDRFF